jgi:hypothetical protein
MLAHHRITEGQSLISVRADPYDLLVLAPWRDWGLISETAGTGELSRTGAIRMAAMKSFGKNDDQEQVALHTQPRMAEANYA